MRRYDLQLFADYCQFFLQDASAEGDLSKAWSPDAVERCLAVAPGVVGIRTQRADVVRVAVEMLACAPSDDAAEYDCVIECSLVVAHGPLVAAGCTDYFPEAARLPAEPGIYRVRASYLRQAGHTEEQYRLQLWPAPAIEPRMLKARSA